MKKRTLIACIALVLLPGVQFLTGQVFDLKRITALAHAQGCVVGFDLAHAVGNVPVDLHDSGADFAVWCSYKYLNSGPGAVAGCFVHARHAETALPRFAGQCPRSSRRRNPRNLGNLLECYWTICHSGRARKNAEKFACTIDCALP